MHPLLWDCVGYFNAFNFNILHLFISLFCNANSLVTTDVFNISVVLPFPKYPEIGFIEY